MDIDNAGEEVLMVPNGGGALARLESHSLGVGSKVDDASGIRVEDLLALCPYFCLRDSAKASPTAIGREGAVGKCGKVENGFQEMHDGGCRIGYLCNAVGSFLL